MEVGVAKRGRGISLSCTEGKEDRQSYNYLRVRRGSVHRVCGVYKDWPPPRSVRNFIFGS